MRALNGHVERVFRTDRKETHWGKRNWRGIDEPVTACHVCSASVAGGMRCRAVNVAFQLARFQPGRFHYSNKQSPSNDSLRAICACRIMHCDVLGLKTL